MDRRRQAGIVLVVAVLAALAGFYVHRFSLTTAASPGAIQKLMSTSLADLNGKPQSLAQWRGEVLVVNFWATWCAPCREEIPALMRAEKKYASKGVKIVGIALDNAGNVADFAKEIGIGYALLIGGMEMLGIAKDLGNRAGVLPFTVVLNRAGSVVHSHAGALTEVSLAAVLSPLL